MAGLKAILGNSVQGKEGPVSVDTFATDDFVVGLYFSAHWCPPCRSFTPVLTECYNMLKAKDKKFEVVFVSSDRDETGFKSYYDSMPWLTIGFNGGMKSKLCEKYNINGIPTLILLKGGSGDTISTDGRSLVTNDKEGNNFPWQ